MYQGLAVGLGPSFGVLVLVALLATLFWCSLKRRYSSVSQKSTEVEIWTISSKKKKKEKKTRREGKGTRWYKEDHTLNIEGTYVIGEEEDYGNGYGGYQDIRSSLAEKPKPVLKRASTEETYENDATKPELKQKHFENKRQDTEDNYTYEN